MLRHATLIALLAFAGCLSAQIFPKIEKEEVKKRIAEGNTNRPEPEPEEEEEPENEPSSHVDGEKAQARYHEILDDYFKNSRATQKATTSHTDDFHPAVQEFFEGVCLLRLGFYRDAERTFKSVKHRVRGEDSIENEEVANLAAEIKSGAAYYYRAMAAALQEWDDFDDREELDKSWQRAVKAAEKVKDELEGLIRRGLIEDGGKWVQAISVWVHEAKDHWVKLWRAEQNIKEYPANVNSWRTLINVTSSRTYKLEEEFVPAYLKQRAAIEVIKEFWPDDEYVTGGRADMAIGANRVSTCQLDDWVAHYAPKPYHSEAGKRALRGARFVMQKLVERIESMKTS